MINIEKLKLILNDYKRDFISQQWKNEKYKWEAVQYFQEHWDINAADFLEMFMKATEKTSNLLTSQNYFPRGMIQNFARREPETVRAMFLNLYDENNDIVERIEKFQTEAERLKEKYGDKTWRQHYQNANSISVYLWLRYPDKYYIYKYSEYLVAARELGSDFLPKKGAGISNLIGGFYFYNEICNQVGQDDELVMLLQSVLTDECYEDKQLKTLTIDIGFYISRFYSEREKQPLNAWYPVDYNPNITVEQWKKLLLDEEVFTFNSLKIMKRMKAYGGMATCTQLSAKYGGTTNFYNVGSSCLAKRVAEITGCQTMEKDTKDFRWWPILYVGKEAEKEREGCWIWKLRDELSEALNMVDLSAVNLYENEKNDNSSRQYWWLNANPRYWKYSDVIIGEKNSCSLYNDNGNKRRIFQNFLDVKEGDFVIGYETNPTKQVVALAKIVEENDGENFYFEKTEDLPVPIDYNVLKKSPELELMEYFSNSQGSLFKLTKQEYEFILQLIRKDNPIIEKESIETYLKKDFLEEVYMSEEKFDTLVSLLKNKKNLILQGAPGVGKTFSAKRLAYAMMEEKDEECIELIQFHQNYSYEDFIMGYKPQGEGFELKKGIFYQFCKKAAANPEKSFFFIIDEINRGNMSKIFGELLMLIEKNYRGTEATLAYNGERFTVPENLYLIGMMNTADRSLAMIDYALRRRFSFVEIEPGFYTDRFKEYQKRLQNDTFDRLIECICELNKKIISDTSLGKGFCIGHSYFCGQKECKEDWMREVVEYDIIPMLSEYWFDEAMELQTWENKLRGVFHG